MSSKRGAGLSSRNFRMTPIKPSRQVEPRFIGPVFDRGIERRGIISYWKKGLGHRKVEGRMVYENFVPVYYDERGNKITNVHTFIRL